MGSQKVEDVHKFLLNKLLADSGLECKRSPAVSAISTPDLQEEEEHGN